MQINAESWESLAYERNEWRPHIHQSLEEYETSRISRAELKRATRKQDISNIPSNPEHVWICNVCSRILLSKAGYANHMKSHNSQSSAPRRELPATFPYIIPLCMFVPYAPRSTSLLVDSNVIFWCTRGTPAATNQKAPFQCSICNLVCKSAACLNSHLSAHGRRNADE